MKNILITLAVLALSLSTNAQTEEEPRRFNLTFQLKNMHYWRGYAVTTAPMMGTSLYYQSPNGQWKMGFWGGMGFDGEYREFDNFISWQKGNFSISLWDIYNFSTPDIAGLGIFDYDNDTTGRFVDLTFAYFFGEKFPFRLSTSTIVLGRDSDFVGSEPTTVVTRTGDLRYTTYIEGRYTIFNEKNHQLQAFIGGAIALAGEGETFYSNRNAINFVGLSYARNVRIGNFIIPVQATPAVNPNAGHAFMELAINFL